MLVGAIRDGAHALRDGLILQRNRGDAGERGRTLHLTVNHVVVLALLLAPPAAEWVAGRGEEIARRRPRRCFEWRQRVPGHRPPHRVGVVQRYPDVSGQALPTAGRNERVEGEQELRDAPVIIVWPFVTLGS